MRRHVSLVLSILLWVVALPAVSALAPATAASVPATAAHDDPPYTILLPYAANDPCGPFDDPFNDNVAGWFTGQSGNLWAEISGGEYRLRFSTPGMMWTVPAPVCPRANYAAAVDARWGNANGGNFIGLLFALDDNREQLAQPQAYLLAVNTNVRRWMVFEVRGGDLRTVIAPTGHDAVQPGNAVNRLAAERAGERILLAINGTQVGELTGVGAAAPVLAGVVAAAYTSQTSTDARFDNFSWHGR